MKEVYSMAVYKYRVSTRDPRFKNRVTRFFYWEEEEFIQDEIPIPDTEVICNGCNENLYNEEKETYGWLIYLTTDDMLKDEPYDIYCDKCVKKYFPKAKEAYPIKISE
jgi:hypothetical protein